MFLKPASSEGVTSRSKTALPFDKRREEVELFLAVSNMGCSLAVLELSESYAISKKVSTWAQSKVGGKGLQGVQSNARIASMAVVKITGILMKPKQAELHVS